MYRKIVEIIILVLIVASGSSPASELQDRLYDAYEVELNGFAEVRQGWRLQDDPYEESASISEARLQLDMGKFLDWGELKLKGDLVGDSVEDRVAGELRELNLLFSPLDTMDIKIGRQVLTWGTGDLLFINDLFPKDWEAFFIGRDDEYLKAPSDAVKMSFFFNPANIDLILSPVFNGSNYIDGERISYWNGAMGRRAGQDFIFDDDAPDAFMEDWEISLRISKNIEGVEAAVYGYHGFWKTPEGLNPVTMKLFYPELSTLGASLRAPVFGGIGNLEAGYYDSGDDTGGDNPFVRNSEVRFLAGFERELARNLTGAVQYYLEWMSDYDQYLENLGDQPAGDEHRHVVTLRLTRLMMNQNLTLSLFTYYSPSDRDGYVRPRAQYKVTDRWTAELGGNLFFGQDEYTFFGQFERNTNMYAGVRWGF